MCVFVFFGGWGWKKEWHLSCYFADCLNLWNHHVCAIFMQTTWAVHVAVLCSFCLMRDSLHVLFREQDMAASVASRLSQGMCLEHWCPCRTPWDSCEFLFCVCNRFIFTLIVWSCCVAPILLRACTPQAKLILLNLNNLVAVHEQQLLEHLEFVQPIGF